MATVNPYDHLITLYKLIIFSQKKPTTVANATIKETGVKDTVSPKVNPKKIVKTDAIPGTCIVCQQETSLKSLHTKYLCNGESESYSQMLLSCYNIQLVSVPANEDLQICEACIDRLQDAFNFRKQVESAYKPLHNSGSRQNGLQMKSQPKSAITINDVEKNSIDILLQSQLNNSSDNLYDDDDEIHNDDWFFDQHESLVEDDSDLKLQNKPEEMVIPELDRFATVCPICNERFSLFRGLTKHYLVHFSSFLCDFCGAGFTKKKNLDRHLEMHAGKRYNCKLCKKHYADSAALVQHVALCHTGIEPYRCSVCGERFKQIESRNKHTAEAHGIAAKVYSCPKCPRTFKRSCMLSQHVRRDHLKIRNHSCSTCGAKFFSRIELNHHMPRHTGIKEYGCNVCGKSYARKKTLTEHLKIHADLRAHVCEHCGQAFIQKCSLKGHLKTHHTKIST